MTLRERKKQRTRLEISDVATRLFAERGFEQVTLAEIAEAAEVSVKTIFNHFGSKEDLYFDRVGELEAGLVATIVARPPGVTILRALRPLLVDNLVPFPGTGWAGLDDPDRYRDFRRFEAAQERSPALGARRATLAVELGEHLLDVVAAELGRDAADPPVGTLVAMIVAALAERDRVLRAAVIAEAPPAEVRGRVVAVVEDALDRLETAYGDVDRPRERPSGERVDAGASSEHVPRPRAGEQALADVDESLARPTG